MKFIDQFMVKWERFLKDARPAIDKTRAFCNKWTKKISEWWKYVRKFQKVFLAVPVVTMAIILTIINMFVLPPVVGLDLQASGEFSIQIAREVAALGPLAVTALCILLMFASRRVLTPWLVSVCSLILPVLIRLINTFPS